MMAITMKRSEFHFRLMYLLLLLAIPLVSLQLPAAFYDHKPSMCVSRLLLETECYGCGMGRALQHLIHLEPHAAVVYNQFSFIVLPLLVVLWFRELKTTLLFCIIRS